MEGESKGGWNGLERGHGYMGAGVFWLRRFVANDDEAGDRPGQIRRSRPLLGASACGSSLACPVRQSRRSPSHWLCSLFSTTSRPPHLFLQLWALLSIIGIAWVDVAGRHKQPRSFRVKHLGMSPGSTSSFCLLTLNQSISRVHRVSIALQSIPGCLQTRQYEVSASSLRLWTVKTCEQSDDEE